MIMRGKRKMTKMEAKKPAIAAAAEADEEAVGVDIVVVDDDCDGIDGDTKEHFAAAEEEVEGFCVE